MRLQVSTLPLSTDWSGLIQRTKRSLLWRWNSMKPVGASCRDHSECGTNYCRYRLHSQKALGTYWSQLQISISENYSTFIYAALSLCNCPHVLQDMSKVSIYSNGPSIKLLLIFTGKIFVLSGSPPKADIHKQDSIRTNTCRQD